MTDISNIKNVTVIGAGQMGAGIAHVLAASGYTTQLYDNSEASLEKGIAGIGKRLDKAIEKEKITADDKAALLSNLSPISSLNDAADSDVVIEAIIENFGIKEQLFKELDETCKPETIIASNTSSISITKMAGTVNRPEQFIGMHFMNPVPVMQLVEVIRGLQTSDATYQATIALCEALGKTPVTAKKDYPGFIVNRILIPMLNEACFVLMEEIATPEQIDTAMKLGTNQPMGPLELADFVGLDTCLYIAQIFHKEFGDSKYRPCPLLIKHVEAGWLGRKTGRGFYTY